MYMNFVGILLKYEWYDLEILERELEFILLKDYMVEFCVYWINWSIVVSID